MISISKPTLVVDEAKTRANIKRMAEKASRNGMNFRPHFKTHQSADVGKWFRDEGVNTITASSVSMARYFVENGWKDITIAFPYNPLEIEVINEISASAQVNVLIESKDALAHLNQHGANGVSYFLKMDVGTHRTGISPSNVALIGSLIDKSSENHEFKGLLGHAGHSYRCRGKEEIKQVYQESVEMFAALEEGLGFRPYISWGDTPTCSVQEDLSAFNELRAGNFAFYDMMQVQIGSCDTENVAVALACPVVSLHPDRNEAVIYGGGVHFSKDSMEVNGAPYFGQAVQMNDSGWTVIEDVYLKKISQEHGILKGPSSFINNLKLGDIVGVLPVHSCMAADLMPGYITFEGTRLTKNQKIL